MRPVSGPGAPPVSLGTALPARSARAGFTLIEVLIALVILGVLMMLGVPALSPWINNAKLNSMADFYLEGVRLARNGAVQKSAASRFVLTPNASNGQYDWEVDWCFPTSAQPCDNLGAGAWSTTTVAAAADPNPNNPSFSIVRSAGSLPISTQVTSTLTPVNTLAIYFNSYGWINTAVQPYLQQMCFDVDGSCVVPLPNPPIRPIAIAVNLSGIAERCDPLVAAADSRACSP